MVKQAICVYGASSPDIDPFYKEQAHLLGELIARSGSPLVCGGGVSGLMASAIEGCLEAGGEAIGVLPAFMIERGWNHPLLSEIVVTPDMHTRKERMAAMAKAVIALPGGCGTLEELLEIITWRQLNLFKGNIVIADLNSYYTPLLTMLDRTIEQGFMHEDHRRLWSVARDAHEAVAHALSPADDTPFTQKIR